MLSASLGLQPGTAFATVAGQVGYPSYCLPEAAPIRLMHLWTQGGELGPFSLVLLAPEPLMHLWTQGRELGLFSLEQLAPEPLVHL